MDETNHDYGSTCDLDYEYYEYGSYYDYASETSCDYLNYNYGSNYDFDYDYCEYSSYYDHARETSCEYPHYSRHLRQEYLGFSVNSTHTTSDYKFTTRGAS